MSAQSSLRKELSMFSVFIWFERTLRHVIRWGDAEVWVGRTGSRSDGLPFVGNMGVVSLFFG